MDWVRCKLFIEVEKSVLVSDLSYEYQFQQFREGRGLVVLKLVSFCGFGPFNSDLKWTKHIGLGQYLKPCYLDQTHQNLQPLKKRSRICASCQNNQVSSKALAKDINCLISSNLSFVL